MALPDGPKSSHVDGRIRLGRACRRFCGGRGALAALSEGRPVAASHAAYHERTVPRRSDEMAPASPSFRRSYKSTRPASAGGSDTQWSRLSAPAGPSGFGQTLPGESSASQAKTQPAASTIVVGQTPLVTRQRDEAGDGRPVHGCSRTRP